MIESISGERPESLRPFEYSERGQMPRCCVDRGQIDAPRGLARMDCLRCPLHILLCKADDILVLAHDLADVADELNTFYCGPCAGLGGEGVAAGEASKAGRKESQHSYEE